MKHYHIAALSCFAFSLLTTFAAASDKSDYSAEQSSNSFYQQGPFAQTVRLATERFKDVQVAIKEGYAAASCVSGPEKGAMGVHFINGALIGDGAVDPTRPEILVYEPLQGGQFLLVAVEYLTLAENWHAVNEAPPVVMGQLFHYAGSPNRYGLPAFYELHVWAWKHNPAGTFADWNPRVSCDAYNPD